MADNWTCDKCLSLVNGKCTTPQITCPTNLKRREEDPPVQDNPVEEAEEDLRSGVILDAKTRLSVLTGLLGSTGGSTARVLYLIEKLSAHYADMTALLGTGARPDEWKPPVEGDEGTSATIGNVAETFGAQAIKQFLALLKEIVAPKTEAEPLPTPILPSFAVHRAPMDHFAASSLVSAMATAKSAGMDDVVASLRAKLDEVLAGNAVEAAPKVLVEPERKEENE